MTLAGREKVKERLVQIKRDCTVMTLAGREKVKERLVKVKRDCTVMSLAGREKVKERLVQITTIYSSLHLSTTTTLNYSTLNISTRMNALKCNLTPANSSRNIINRPEYSLGFHEEKIYQRKASTSYYLLHQISYDKVGQLSEY